MNQFIQLWRQLRAHWEKSSRTYQVALVASTVAAIVVVLGVGWWSTRPQYIVLAKGLVATETADMIDQLQAASIPYQLGFSGSSISVPSQQWNAAKLATKDVVGEGKVEDPFSMGFMDDPMIKRQRLLHEREKLLAKTILRMSAIADAEVHLAVPDPTPFERDQVEPTASVVLGIKRGSVFTLEQATSVARLVAGSVEGMKMENVTVTDLDGKTYSLHGQSQGQELDRQLQFQRQLEAEKSAEAERLLAGMLGPGHAMVTVTAEIDFTKTTREGEQFDKDQQVKKTERITSTNSKGMGPTGQGAAGVATNLAGGAKTTNLAGSTQENETVDVEFENGRTTETTIVPGGKILRLTVAALIDPPQADPNAVPPVAPLDVQKVQNLIKQAVGFDSTRNDQIEVLQAPLQGMATTVPTMFETLDQWEFYNRLVRNASLGLAAIVALVLGFLLIRKLQPMAIAAPVAVATSSSRDSMLSELAAESQQNPEVMAQIFAAWLNATDTGGMTAGATRSRPERMAA